MREITEPFKISRDPSAIRDRYSPMKPSLQGRPSWIPIPSWETAEFRCTRSSLIFTHDAIFRPRPFAPTRLNLGGKPIDEKMASVRVS